MIGYTETFWSPYTFCAYGIAVGCNSYNIKEWITLKLIDKILSILQLQYTYNKQGIFSISHETYFRIVSTNKYFVQQIYCTHVVTRLILFCKEHNLKQILCN